MYVLFLISTLLHAWNSNLRVSLFPLIPPCAFATFVGAVRLGQRLMFAVHADTVRHLLLPVRRRTPRGPAVQLLRRALDLPRLRSRLQLPGVLHGLPEVPESMDLASPTLT